MIERLKRLQLSKGNYRNGSELAKAIEKDKSLKNEIQALSKAFLNRSVSGCGNCYMDAYIQLINYSMEKAINKENSQFSLPHGRLIHDVVNRDVSLNMTQHNISDDLALYHLKTNPNAIAYFDKKPKDWEKQAEEFDINKFLKLRNIKTSYKNTKVPKKRKKKEIADVPEMKDEEKIEESMD